MEKKKVIFLIASVAMILAMGSYIVFTNYSESWESPNSRKMPKLDSNKLNTTSKVNSIEETLLLNNDHLITQLTQLMELDVQFSEWPIDSAAGDRKIQEVYRQSLENLIKSELDSLQQISLGLSDKNTRLQNRALIFYRELLGSRIAENTYHEIESVKASETPFNNATIDKLQYELIKKDELIMDLNQKLSATQDRLDNGADSIRIASSMANYSDKSLEREKQFDDLRQRYELLQKEYQQLANKAQRAETKANQSDELFGKISELEASLRLAEVSCNLTRADSKEIIYNAKQRKALLENSLLILKNLSLSSNAIVQRKAKEKMNELRTIASTIRD